ncbi:transglycosylase SLT domain-containing protein [Aliirhizobium terrae]|uniref:lytic transglycosylase domain-containing protein n=1 Tax=Terrirhizobium terrae TaxID=2926709 RepID=UPI00257874FF|nr:transglycosylase SLT domain-containing protein [Rhizobium sp. CC-CFT758]WJH41200.1 transglycosylase SLT domain-containing protein [Rhizobium sp. CC-CFT758]
MRQAVTIGMALVISALAAGPAMAEPVASAPAEAAPGVGQATGRDAIVALITQEANRQGLPPEIAEAVVHTESGFNVHAVGADGEIGLMQVMPSTARMLGFSGGLDALAVPETNISLGVTYLAQAWRRAGRDLCTTVMKYRAGHGETRFSHLSVDYCLKVRARLKSRGFAVTGSVPAATFGRPGTPGHCRGTCLAGSGGTADIEAFNRRINEIVLKVTVKQLPGR